MYLSRAANQATRRKKLYKHRHASGHDLWRRVKKNHIKKCPMTDLYHDTCQDTTRACTDPPELLAPRESHRNDRGRTEEPRTCCLGRSSRLFQRDFRPSSESSSRDPSVKSSVLTVSSLQFFILSVCLLQRVSQWSSRSVWLKNCFRLNRRQFFLRKCLDSRPKMMKSRLGARQLHAH